MKVFGLLFSILILFQGSGCQKQQKKDLERNSSIVVRESIDQLTKSIAIENELVSSAVGYAGEETPQWRRYIKLKNEATEDELRQLTSHENAVVRAYSFQALVERTNKDIFPIIIEHLSDTTSLNTFFGCLEGSQMTGDYFIEIVTPGYIDPNLDIYELTQKESTTLDSLLLYGKDIKLYAKSRVLERLSLTDEHYHRIREIAETEKNFYALMALAKYQKINDKYLIIEIYNQGDIYDFIRIIRYFPDKFFFPYLEKIYNAEIKKTTGFNYPLLRNLYQVLAQYPNAKTRNMFEQTLIINNEVTRKYHTEFLWLALIKYPNPIFDGLIDKIKLDDFMRQELEDWIDKDY